MHLTHLCIILPSDFDEIEEHELAHPTPQANEIKQVKAKKQPQGACGGKVVAFLHGSMTRLHDSKWGRSLCTHGARKTKHKKNSIVFHDMDGVPLFNKIGRDKENPRIFGYAELYIGSRGFSEEEVLGSGGFGKVYKAVLPSDGTLVAVKSCLAGKRVQFEKSFAAELASVAHLRHKNLVRLRGWCVFEDQLYLVYDYMPNLSLDRVLFRRPENLKEEPLGWLRRRKIVKGLADALYYLHEQLETQIIHRDVKTSNVMLDSHYNARLGDFGLARWLEHELEYETRKTSTKFDHFNLAETTRIGGTIGYLPPESFQRKSIATSKSDVFSFGIVVLEVVSGRRAIDLTYPDDQIILLDWIRRLSDERKFDDAGDSRLLNGSYNIFQMKHLIHIGLLCTLHDPKLRPSMKWIVEALSDISSKLPPLPSFHSHPMYISLSSSSETSPSSTRGTGSGIDNASNHASSKYVTANGDTVYVTAEAEHRNSGIRSSKSNSMIHQPPFPIVETPREISYKEIVLAIDNFSESRRVAELDFGTAYHGILDGHYHVMVKRLGMKTCPALRHRFSNELRNLARLHHRNLVQLRGWCTEQGEMLVVYDYSARKILSHKLHHHHNNGSRNECSVLKWHQRYNIVKSLASALLYLHEEWDEKVIHRNITSSAIFLEPDMTPRLGSFALAEFLSRNENSHHAITDTSKSVRGIFGYMSPEYVESGEATIACDVYSFGVVVLEVISGHMAVDFRQKEVLLVKKVREFEMRKRPLHELADIGLNGEYSYKEFMRLVRLGIACTQSDPKLRPSTRQIVSIIDGNDKLIMGENMESMEEWRRRNACSLSLVKRIQALGIQ
ncbi:receptor like protein kinase S.2-like [Gastrolobium bilobum]|uniref:receptor like protein kinase S.2-like n=1 Tax=Gastrolobium bilobum TaxID=150636 RepID=UPI002AB09A29|nr:receptor like protein kinase S.2-like [Gastrolobium bilobum]